MIREVVFVSHPRALKEEDLRKIEREYGNKIIAVAPYATADTESKALSLSSHALHEGTGYGGVARVLVRGVRITPRMESEIAIAVEKGVLVTCDDDRIAIQFSQCCRRIREERAADSSEDFCPDGC